MSDASPPRLDTQQCVTASDLVRHFGIWQERAARAPVYVMHRGRPRLALTSLDVMQALCAPHRVGAGDNAKLAALLDAIDDVALIVDQSGAIVASSRAARARFGDATRIGGDAAAIATGSGFLSEAIARVAATGATEQVEVIPARYPTRRIACVVSPFPNGCLIRAHDLTAEEQLATTHARAAALTGAVEVVGAATVRIGLRGYLLDAPNSLARLIGVTREALETVRFVSLIDVAGRVAIGEAIEAAISELVPRRVVTSLLVRGADSLPVAIGLAGLPPAARIEEVIATIIPLNTESSVRTRHS